MGNKRYISGRNFEYKVKNYLKSLGYFIMRSAGSKGAFDLVALRNDIIMLVQVKKTPINPNKIEIQQITLQEYNSGIIPDKNKITIIKDLDYPQYIAYPDKQLKKVNFIELK